jgi:type II secretion system protein C
MLRRSLTAAQAILGSACAVALVSLLASLLAIVDPPPSPGGAVEVSSWPPPGQVAANAGPGQYAIIVERNLFEAPRGVDIPLAPASQLRLPETGLPLLLRGTAVARPVERSLAVIEDQRQSDVVIVRVGTSIAGARVERIERTRVIVRYRGRREQLLLPGAEVSGVASARPAAAESTTPIAGDRGEEARAADRVRGLRPRARAAARGSRPDRQAPQDTALDSPPASPDAAEQDRLMELSQQARFLPQFGDAGELRGIVITDIRASSTLERIGLRDGDVVLAIGDNRIENAEQVVPALRSLDGSTNIEIEIERGGILQTVEVPAGTL